MMGTSAVVASTIPLAVGYAYSCKLRHTPSVVASFFGDGATEEGVFHESLSFARLKRLPILFVCENNFYAIHTHQRERQPLDNICERARAHGIAAEQFDDGDPLALHEHMRAAVGRIRAGEGPLFVECRAYRWKEHVGPGDDFHLGYRERAEAAPWIERDPCRRLAAMLDPTVRNRIEAEVEAEVADAIAFAEASPFPDEMDLYTDLVKES
jgi:TPP-dependent pyruvate/acetoin dehydrogenase alpha subunit